MYDEGEKKNGITGVVIARPIYHPNLTSFFPNPGPSSYSSPVFSPCFLDTTVMITMITIII